MDYSILRLPITRRRRAGALDVRITVKETTMQNHTGHTLGMPAKPDAAKPSTPAKPDPHAGHDMSKPQKPGTPPKGAEKK